MENRHVHVRRSKVSTGRSKIDLGFGCRAIFITASACRRKHRRAPRICDSVIGDLDCDAAAWHNQKNNT